MRFAIAAIGEKENDGGRSKNIQHIMRIISADNKSEAIGLFTAEFYKALPQHAMFLHPVFMLIDDSQEAKE